MEWNWINTKLYAWSTSCISKHFLLKRHALLNWEMTVKSPNHLIFNTVQSINFLAVAVLVSNRFRKGSTVNSFMSVCEHWRRWNGILSYPGQQGHFFWPLSTLRITGILLQHKFSCFMKFYEFIVFVSSHFTALHCFQYARVLDFFFFSRLIRFQPWCAAMSIEFSQTLQNPEFGPLQLRLNEQCDTNSNQTNKQTTPPKKTNTGSPSCKWLSSSTMWKTKDQKKKKWFL